jgi:hypothetical protein
MPSSGGKAYLAIRTGRIADVKALLGEREREGDRHGGKADSDRQLRLSVSSDPKAIVAHAAIAGAGSTRVT